MAKDKLTEYDATANNNTICGDVNIAENSALPSDMNNFAREIMSHLKEGLGSGTPLYVDQTNNRVGVNKTPTVALDVNGALSVSGAFTSQGIDDNADAVAITIGSDEVVDFASNADFIDGRGIRLGNGNDFQLYHDGTNNYINGTTSTNMLFLTNGSERMRIANSGNLGLGTSSPAKQLHLKSATPTLRLEDSDQTSPATPFDITVSTDNINIKEMANNRNLWYADSGGTQIFYTAGSERMRISSDGSKNFGTNTSGSGGFNLYVGSANTGSFACRFDGVGTGSSNVLQFVNGYGQVGSVTLSGASTAYNTSSDHRLKENVTSDWDATTRLKQLNPVRFNFIVDADTTVDGFLAHEVQSVVPEAITGTHNEVQVWQDGEELPDGVSVGDNKLDEDGNTIPIYQGIDQSKIVPLLTKTILELEARITALEGA